jgi:hypothetical protein
LKFPIISTKNDVGTIVKEAFYYVNIKDYGRSYEITPLFETQNHKEVMMFDNHLIKETNSWKVGDLVYIDREEAQAYNLRTKTRTSFSGLHLE